MKPKKINRRNENTNFWGRFPKDLSKMFKILKLFFVSFFSLQGCAYFAHVLQNPKEYGVRQGLTESFITAFYNLLWGFPINKLGTQAMAIIHSRINLVVLEASSEFCGESELIASNYLVF